MQRQTDSLSWWCEWCQCVVPTAERAERDHLNTTVIVLMRQMLLTASISGGDHTSHFLCNDRRKALFELRGTYFSHTMIVALTLHVNVTIQSSKTIFNIKLLLGQPLKRPLTINKYTLFFPV